MPQLTDAPCHEIIISRQEVLRYLHCSNNVKEEKILALVDKYIYQMQPLLACKACFKYFPVSFSADRTLHLGFCETNSADLKKTLDGCREILLFVATIGISVDRMIQKQSLLSPLHALAAQAVGTAAIESFCDLLCKRFAEKESKNGRYLRPRFSPGYGDLSLDIQQDIIRHLDCNRKIGITLTSSLQMLPSKSVSALVGLSTKPFHHCSPACSLCQSIDCQFRRRTV